MDKLTKRALQAQVEAAVRPPVLVSDEPPKTKTDFSTERRP